MSYSAKFMVQPVQEAFLAHITCPPGQLFPDAGDILRDDPLADCTRIGVGTTIVDDQGRLLMLAHNESAKCKQDALGPMTETVQWAPAPETTLQTMVRGVHEELG